MCNRDYMAHKTLNIYYLSLYVQVYKFLAHVTRNTFLWKLSVSFSYSEL